jgi:hypothetical protein
MKKSARVKKIDTIEKLAMLVADGFSDMDARFSDMDVRFSDMDARFSDMDARFSDMDSRFVELKEVLKNMDKRLAAVESKVWGIERRLDSEAMERLDIRSIFARMEKIELAVFGNKR